MADLALNLKQKLDEIDNRIVQEVSDGFFQSRLKILIGKWEKGAAIGQFRGVNCPSSYRELARQTGRSHHSLKTWYDLYSEHSDRERYIEGVAKPEAIGWAQKALTKALSDKGDWYQLSETSEWETPQWFFDILDSEFHFEIDVCATPQNAKCKRFFSKKENGLKQQWAPKKCWMNPPYGREVPEWISKAVEESKKGATVVCLVPSRTDTDWWWENCLLGEIRFIRGRLKFGGDSEAGAPMASAVVILSPSHKGKVVWWNIYRTT